MLGEGKIMTCANPPLPPAHPMRAGWGASQGKAHLPLPWAIVKALRTPPKHCSSLYYVQDTSSPEGVITVKKDEKGHSVNHYFGNLNKCICAHFDYR